MLEPGQRLFDFVRRDHNGEPFHLYAEVLGAPLVLLVLRDKAASCPESLRWSNCQLPLTIALRQASTEENVKWRERNDFSGLVLSDNGEVADAVLGDREDDTVFLTDRNLRIKSHCSARNADDLRAMIKNEEPKEREVRPLTQIAPLLIVPRVLSVEECDKLVALFDREGGKPSGMPRSFELGAPLVVDHTSKVREDLRLEGRQEDAWLAGVIARRLLPEVERVFSYRPKGYESLKLVCYGAHGKGHFRPHRDNLAPSTRRRRLALSIQLNEGQYEGGCLRFPEYGRDLYSPPKGAALVFPCSLAHEVTPIEKGRRYAIVSFLLDEAPAD